MISNSGRTPFMIRTLRTPRTPHIKKTTPPYRQLRLWKTLKPPNNELKQRSVELKRLNTGLKRLKRTEIIGVNMQKTSPTP